MQPTPRRSRARMRTIGNSMRYQKLGSDERDKVVVMRRRGCAAFIQVPVFERSARVVGGRPNPKKRAPKRPLRNSLPKKTSVHADVRVLAVAAGLAIAPVREELELAFLA